jgi:hypothetical protein
MTFASSFRTALSFSAALAIVGCGSSGTSSNAFRNGGGGSGLDATASGDDGGSSSGGSSGGYASSSGGNGSSGGSGSSGGGCPGSCNVDTDCQNTCPAAPSGSSNCCEGSSHTCYVTMTAACPAQQTGAAE